ncbi:MULTISPECIES: phage tail assembly chaperone [Pseudomonas]|uniref:Phage tail assembly chaperone n=1 Tax=Pseudomonas tritici TaxID=2745518 RepID=A0A8H9YKV8_9PSED|nr:MULTISPECIES: phage tail assembly chaperone [Pseudomonas]MBP2872921.1 hypothetical protein [Pseudomonas sp. SWRI144]QXH82655.1 phage tail assembly chaperone [Pseudomonas tritici]
MSFAICVDRPAFRAVSGPDDVGPGEYWSQFPLDNVPLLSGAEEAALQERVWRDSALSSALWLRERHRDQLEIEHPTTLTQEQFTSLLVYMQALRDWPQSPDFPNSDHRPIAPDWIETQIR